MRKYIYISGGGALGALCRFISGKMPIDDLLGYIPLNTLIVNLTGIFLLVILVTLIFEVIKVNDNIKLGLVTGLLSGFTTFSTLCKEVSILLANGRIFYALLYVLGSVLFGLAAAYFGSFLARVVIDKAGLEKIKIKNLKVIADSEGE